MHILLLFLDGVGLGADDPENNPFATAQLPALTSMTGGKRWLRGLERISTERAVFIPTDACLGVKGRPQSATGQATIMTGVNVSQQVGGHYGPKPDADIRAIIERESLAKKLAQKGNSISFLNAYPPRFFENINNGKRLLSSNQYAMHVAGVTMRDADALYAGEALSADFTGEGWRTMLNYPDAPLLAPQQAGARFAELSSQTAFTLFDHWVTDYTGHRGTLEEGIHRLEILDGVVEGLLHAWDDSAGLAIITSDHGNIEDLDARGHTRNPVPTVIIGEASHAFAEGLTDLTGFAPRILSALA